VISFWRLRKALGLVRAADRQFTGSVEGIRDAFDLHQDELVRQYKGLRDAVAEVEMVIEQDRQRLTEINKEEEERLTNRDGALTLFEQARAAKDEAAMKKHQEAFERFDARIQKIEEEQKLLAERIKRSETNLEDYLRQLTKMQDEVRKLPGEKARAIADFVSANKLIELNDRLQSLKTSIERGPIDAVLEQNRRLTAKAQVTARIAGTDVERQDEQYASAGRTSTSQERMQQMLAARSAERDEKTGKKEPGKKDDERPEI
jgi:chromosome segregation ATPase